MKNTTRVFSPYEQTLLARSNMSQIRPHDVGRQPIEQIVGWVEFYNLKFKVNRQVLIPRIETENLVKMATAAVRSRIATSSTHVPVMVADVGTGSGAIAISLFHQLSQTEKKLVKIFLSDISTAALQIAQINAQKLLSDDWHKLKFLTSDLLKNYPANFKADVIVANLPYIPSSRIDVLDKSVRQYEPLLALDGGETGLDLISRLVNQAKSKLKKNGVIILEIDESHNLNQLQQVLGHFWQIQIMTDYRNQNRYCHLSRSTSNAI